VEAGLLVTAYTLLSDSDVPNHLDTYTASLVNGVTFAVSAPAVLSKIRTYSFAGAGQLPAEAGLFDSGGAEVFHDASPAWSGAAGSGWVHVPYSQALAAGTYTAAAWNGAAAGQEWYAITAAGWGPVTNGPLSCAANPNSYNDSGTSTFVFPATAYGAFNIWLDVEVTVASGTVSRLLMASII
jgi:hypothetical protein